MTDCLDLFVLDTQNPDSLTAFARNGPDTAIEQLPIAGELADLLAIGRAIGRSMAGQGEHHTRDEIDAFGRRLFNFLFKGDLKTLYDRLPAAGAISIQILSNRADVQEIPWEYVVTPNRVNVPHRERSIIRVHPTCGIDPPPLGKRWPKDKKLNVLFVWADPVNEADVPWEEVAEVYVKTFNASGSESVRFKMVQGANVANLTAAIARESFDVFHFLGHGVLVHGEGHVVLEDPVIGASALLSGRDLARILAGKKVRLAILSACSTSAGHARGDFGAVATALIMTGVPAVIANQYPIPAKTISPFVNSVYESLLRDGDIDAAVAEGRTTMSVAFDRYTGTGIVEWGIPTLHRMANARQLYK